MREKCDGLTETDSTQTLRALWEAGWNCAGKFSDGKEKHPVCILSWVPGQL